MKRWHNGAAYTKALKKLFVPIFVSTEEAREWGSQLNAKQHATLLKTQWAMSKTACAEPNLQRKINFATQSQLMREAAEAFAPA